MLLKYYIRKYSLIAYHISRHLAKLLNLKLNNLNKKTIRLKVKRQDKKK